MKKYNVKNYVRYKEDLKRTNGRIPIKNFTVQVTECIPCVLWVFHGKTKRGKPAS